MNEILLSYKLFDDAAHSEASLAISTKKSAPTCCGSPTSTCTRTCTCTIAHLHRNSCKPLEGLLHRESVFQSVITEDQIEASLVVGVPLHDGIILTNRILPAGGSNQGMRAQAKLGWSLRWLQTLAFVAGIERGSTTSWWLSLEQSSNTTKSIHNRTLPEIAPCAQKRFQCCG